MGYGMLLVVFGLQPFTRHDFGGREDDTNVEQWALPNSVGVTVNSGASTPSQGACTGS
jgi:hypothetical protein